MIPPIHRIGKQDYGTPPEAVEPLIPFLKKFRVLWDPLTGPENNNLALAKTLEQHGFEVFTSSRSFFEFFAPPPGIEAIVTNPPYSDTERYIAHAYVLLIPFCFLIPLIKISNRGMYSMIKQYGFELMILPGRLNYVGGKDSAPFPSCWLCHWVLPEKLVLV